MTFQKLYGELHASLSLKTDAERAVARDRASSAADTAVDAVTSVYFGGQGRYAVANTGSATRLSARPAGEHRAAGPPRRGGCWNCGDKTHRLAACPAKVNWERVHKQRTDFWAEQRPAKDVATTVYYEMCQELRGASLKDVVETRDVNESDNGALTNDQAADGDKQQDAPSSTGDGDGAKSDTAELYYGLTGAMCDADTGNSDSGPGFPPGV